MKRILVALIVMVMIGVNTEEFKCEEQAEAEQEAAEQAAAEQAVATNVYYENCTDVCNHGAALLYVGDPGWQDKFDRDGDGVACEQ